MEHTINLCKLKKSSEMTPVCSRKSRGSEALSYQQQILSQAKSLGQLRRHYIARKCFENKINEKKALDEIFQYKSCYPCCSEMQLLQILIDSDACPETIIYQTFIVESEKGKCGGAEEAYRKLKQAPTASARRSLIYPCCDEDNPVGHGLLEQARQKATSRRPCKRQAGKPRPQPSHRSSPFPRQPAQTPCARAAAKPCSPCATPLPCPGPLSPSQKPIMPLTPCQQEDPCPDSSFGQPVQSSTPVREGGAGYFGSPYGQTPAFLLSPGKTPKTVATKRKTKIPVAIREDLTKSQKRPTRDTTGSRIPCPISTELPRSTRFSRIDDSYHFGTSGREEMSLGQEGSRRDEMSYGQESSRADEMSYGQGSRRRISFGGTKVSYFEDTMAGLLGRTQMEESQSFAIPLSPSTPIQPREFKEYKSMIDQEKKEIREMQSVVTQLMDRPEKVEFRDMYTLVPQISYIDETLTDPAPEVVAAMLHSDELGLNMKSPPAEVYNTLFKGGDKDKTLIQVTPEENAQSVAPVSSEGFEATLLGYEQQGLFENVSTEMDFDLPEMPQPKRKEDGSEESDETVKDQTQHGEDSQEQIPPPRMSSIHSGASEESDELFDVQLQIDLQSTCDFLQVRGSQPPTWFPGYYVAMGDSSKINVVRKPWDILEKAWRKFEPSTLKPDNGTYVLGI